jgi:hypothetical protein
MELTEKYADKTPRFDHFDNFPWDPTSYSALNYATRVDG